MNKYIHYCWFGNNKLSKLTQECIESWKEYLPDYEIIKWDETNCDIEENVFVKEAYENKKWAFVADYFRVKALNEYGGIYFDTDMKIIKDIKPLLEKRTILGLEDSGDIAAGFWYEPECNSKLTTSLMDYYRSQTYFDIDNTFKYAIPKLIKRILSENYFITYSQEIQKFEDLIIYPQEYFYPMSYDHLHNKFTDNTYMIHYYDATWTPKQEKKEIEMIRKYGYEKAAQKGNKGIKYYTKRLFKIVFAPVFKKRDAIIHLNEVTRKKENIKNDFQKCNKSDVLAVYNKEWLGTSFATKELFDNTIGITTLDDMDLIDYCAKMIAAKKYRLIIFSAFDLSWNDLIKSIKKYNPAQQIKILWHGSNAMNIENYDWEVLKSIFDLLNNDYIISIGFVKKSLYEFYKSKGYTVEFVMNTINISGLDIPLKEKSKCTKIGVYASGDRWVKNFYNQLSAASMIDNHLIDCIPINKKTKEFATLIKANLIGEYQPIPREELLKRLSQNDINLYTTFVECAPLLPLESLELGVPCITSNNHHYWEGTELEKYLVVNAPDNIIEIKNKIELVLKNKDKILKIYGQWKNDYDKQVTKSVRNFLK